MGGNAGPNKALRRGEGVQPWFASKTKQTKKRNKMAKQSRKKNRGR